MNVLLFTTDEPMYMPRYLEPVVAAHRDKLTEIVLAPVPGEDLRTVVEQRYRMFGPKAFALYGLRYGVGKLLATLPTSIARPMTAKYHSVTDLAAAYDIPVTTEQDVNREGFVDRVRRQSPDLVLSVACGQRLGESLLSIPEHGCINVHGSLLPKYRGRATAFWVLYNDEDESGVTAHYMTPEFDAGPILAQRRFPIVDDDTMDDVYEKVVDTGSELVVDLLNQFAAGDNLSTDPNTTHEGEYRSLPDPEERREFLRRGNKFL